jgi:tetratricopeptide (TPR) repeat protein
MLLVFALGVGGGAALVSFCSSGPPDRQASPPALAESTGAPSPSGTETSAAVDPQDSKPAVEVAPKADVAPRRLFGEVLELNTVQEPELDRETLRAAFEEIAGRAREAAASEKTPRGKIAALNRVLLADRKVSYLSNKYWRDATLAATVLRARGNCLATSTLYVLVGEALGLPLRLVIVPDHAFVRWDDGTVRINIETTSRGIELPDAYYFETQPCTPRDREMLGWGESQDADGFLAEIVLTAARHRHGENRLDEALGLVDRALRLKPGRLDVKLWRARIRADMTADRRRFRREVIEMLRSDAPPPSVVTDATLALAMDYGATGDHERERDMLVRAFAAAPKNKQQGVLERLAFCHRSLKDFRGAVRYMELALAFAPTDPRDPRRPTLLYNLAILQKNDGRLKDALASIEEAQRCNPEAWSLKIIKAGYLVLDGRRGEGLALFARIKDEKPRGQEEFYNVMIPWFYAVSEQRERFYSAFAYALERASSIYMLHWIDQDVDLDVYRDESEFKALVARHSARLLGRVREPAPGPAAEDSTAPARDGAPATPAAR